MRKEIEAYVRYNKNGKLEKIDGDEFTYQPEGKTYTIKGFKENVEEWIKSLITVCGEKYQVADWWKTKNEIDWNILIGEAENLTVRNETDKAYHITNNNGSNMWVPKSVMKKIEEI